MLRYLRFRWIELLTKLALVVCALVPLILLLSVIATSIVNGSERFSWSFVMEPMAYGGQAGGVLFQIIGTSILIIVTGLIVTPLALALAIVTTQSQLQGLKEKVLSLLHLLNATPSILFGIIGFIFFIKICSWDKSWFSGAVILALMILPTVTVSLISRIETIPRSYVETALSLGLDRDQMIKSTIVPYSYGALLTGLVMGLARAAGETAPIMFVAAVFSGASWPKGISDSPVLALPYHIFNLSQDAYFENAVSGAWASVLVLLLLVLTLSLIVMPFRLKAHEEAS